MELNEEAVLAAVNDLHARTGQRVFTLIDIAEAIEGQRVTPPPGARTHRRPRQPPPRAGPANHGPSQDNQQHPGAARRRGEAAGNADRHGGVPAREPVILIYGSDAQGLIRWACRLGGKATPLVDEAITTTLACPGAPMLFYRAVLPLSRATLVYVAGVIRRHRRQIGSCWRKLNPGQQALLVLAHLRNGGTFAELAAGYGVSTATAWQYVTEAVRLLAARAPSLRTAVWAAKKAQHAFVVIDGTLIPSTVSPLTGPSTPASIAATA